jgi:DNA-binding response OmpR family regulator
MDTKKKIFIVDDDTFLLDMYALKFNQSGFSVDTATGPLKALEKLHNGYTPDIMILDIVMPDMDGFELLEKMKEESLIPNTIKVVLSNRGQQSDIIRGQSLGASGYIVKANSTPAEVVLKVTEIINKIKLSS